jgi:beta-lactamase regulating signal transducer with metallopeptidase domain
MKVFAMLTVGFVALGLMRRRSAAARHWTLAVTIACSAAVPLFQAVAPAWRLPLRAAPVTSGASPRVSMSFAVAGPGAVDAARPAGAGPSSDQPLAERLLAWFLRVQLAGAALGVLVLATGLARLEWIASHATVVSSGRLASIWCGLLGELGITRRITLLQTDAAPMLMTWGVVRPRVVLPRSADDWSDERVRAVLLHELAHVRRGDWLMLMIAELLRAVDWVNPLTWLAARRLRIESELACDDEVLAAGVPAPEYAGHLVALVRLARLGHGRPALAASAMARPSGIERRVAAMLNDRLERVPATRFSRGLIGGTLFAAALCISGYGLSAQALTSVSGAVYDPQNLGVPGVMVSLLDPRTDARHEVKSDATGRFEFAGVTSGDYRLEARVPGFATLTRTVSVAGRHVDQDLTLALGAVQETITLAYSPNAEPEQMVFVGKGPAPQPRACQATGAGGNIRPPMKVKNVRPVYPVKDGNADEGTVLIDARIGTDGTVVSAVPREPVNPGLAEAATVAVTQWEFTPTLLNCVPVEVAMAVNVRFEKK